MNRRPCKWKLSRCRKPRWSPYSRFCPQHYAEAALAGLAHKTRARLCFRLTIYGPRGGDGNKWWAPNYKNYEEILAGAQILGVEPETADKIDWKNLVMNMLEPNKRKVVTDAGRTMTTSRINSATESTISDAMLPPSKRTKVADSARNWRLDFPGVPECRICDSPKELVLGDMQDWEEGGDWRIGDRRMRPLRNRDPEWFEFWNWVCPTCDTHKIDHSVDLMEIRRLRIYDPH